MLCLHNDKQMWSWWPDACLRWSTKVDVQNSQVNTAVTLADCYTACLNQATCTGVVYVFTGTSGQRCNLEIPTATESITGSAPGMYRYLLERGCRGNDEFTCQLVNAQPTSHYANYAPNRAADFGRADDFCGRRQFVIGLCAFLFLI